jgi:hypothetical protein
MNDEDKEYISELLKKEPEGWLKEYIEKAKEVQNKQQGVYLPVPEITTGPEPGEKE